MVAEKGEKFLYIENKTGSNLILGFTISNMVAYLISMNHVSVNYNIFWFSIFNIAFTLLAFLMSTKQKMYSKKWVYAAVPVVIVQIIQIVRYPNLQAETSTKIVIYALLILSVVCISSGSLLTLKRIRLREKFS
jgi:uncharacterized membrane protein